MKSKKLVLVGLFLSSVLALSAQTGWGLKGGLIYNSNGELKNNVGEIIDKSGKGEAGFQVGVFANLKLGPISIKPELLYSQTSSEYDNDGTVSSLKRKTIDLPVLVGFKIIGPLKLMVGPAFEFNLDNKIDEFEYDSIKNEISVGFNIGASVRIKRIGIELIYSRGFNSNEAALIGSSTEYFTLDTRPKQINLGLTYTLSKI